MRQLKIQRTKRDGRKYDHETLESIRFEALTEVANGASPEAVIRSLGLSRSCIYKWLAKFRIGGMVALKSKSIPGRPPKLELSQLTWVNTRLLETTPEALNFSAGLWSRKIVRDLIQHQYGIKLSLASISRLLVGFGVTFHPPIYHLNDRDYPPLKNWLAQEYLKIKREAKKNRAEIFMGWEDVVPYAWHNQAILQISAVSARGLEHFLLTSGSEEEASHQKFISGLCYNRKRPVYLILKNSTLNTIQGLKRQNDQALLSIYSMPSLDTPGQHR